MPDGVRALAAEAATAAADSSMVRFASPRAFPDSLRVRGRRAVRGCVLRRGDAVLLAEEDAPRGDRLHAHTQPHRRGERRRVECVRAAPHLLLDHHDDREEHADEQPARRVGPPSAPDRAGRRDARPSVRAYPPPAAAEQLVKPTVRWWSEVNNAA